MTFDVSKFCVTNGKKFRLKDYSTLVDPFYKSKKDYKKILDRNVEEMTEQQSMLFASADYSLLIIFQAMDAAGKDGAIKHVMSGVNPQGCYVQNFKQPSSLELKHSFLWRASLALPQRGEIAIFNRSYYEDVLITRVHPEILNASKLPDKKFDKEFWDNRYKDIRNFEEHLHRNGTRILKFFLYVSKEEQRQRLLDRINIVEKNWKLSMGDFEERKSWDQYMSAFEKAIQNTSTPECPWYCVPADDKQNARLIVSAAIMKILRELKLSYPQPSVNHQDELELLRKKLEE